MDVTNPGLVNVANQAFKSDVRVNSLAIPRDDDTLVPIANEGEPLAPNNPASQAVPFNDDTLVPVANQGEPQAENDVTSSIVPVPVESIVATQAAVPVSQNFGTVPGIAPLFPPFPPGPNDPEVAKQNLTARNVNDFTVAGPDISIQTNQSTETQKNYAVTAAIDADTGLPPSVPVPSTTKPFISTRNGGTGIVTVVVPSSGDLPASGEAVSIAGTPATYNGLVPVSNVRSLNGSFSEAATNISTTGTSLGSTTILPSDLLAAKWISISGSSIAAYNGIHAVNNVISLGGNFTWAANTDPTGTKIVIVSPTQLPASLADGQLVYLQGTYGWATISDVVNISGSFISVAPSIVPGHMTFTSVSVLPAALQNGQQIAIRNTINFNGTYEVSAVTSNTFDIVHASAVTEIGNWSVWTFNITAALAATGGTWTAYTFDIDVVYAGSPGMSVWQVYTFDIPGIYSVTSSGFWTYTPLQPPPTTRYKLIVAPSNLTAWGVSMLGRPIVFDNSILTVANEGASRDITGYGSNFVVVNRSNDGDQLVPYMDNPQAGDTFTLDVQRQGSEVISRDTGTVEDVTILPPPQVNLSTGIPSAPSQGNVEVSTGPQPGKPAIASGVNVPTAITVNVADQDLIGPGLPKNVFP